MTTGRQANTNREINWVTDEDGNVLGYMKDGKTLIPFTEVPMRLLTATTNAATPYDRGLTYNNASNGTIDCPAGALPEGAVIQQINTGTITANAGSGVTWIKSDDGTTVTTLSTTAKGKQIIITKTAVANTFIVQALAGLGSGNFLSGLVAYWDFSESSAPFVSKAGTAGPVALIQGPGSAVTKVADGPTGNAVRFNGTSDYLICEAVNTGFLNIGKNGGNNVTVLAFVKMNANSTGDFIAGMWQEDNANPRRQYGLFYSLPIYGGNFRGCMHISKTGGASPGIPFSRDYSANLATQGDTSWSCISGTYDGSFIRSYWDGRFEPYLNYTEPNAPDGEGLTYDKNPYAFNLGLNTQDCDFTVGAVRLTSAMGNFMSGDISGIMVFNRTLSDLELAKVQRYIDSTNAYGFRNSFFRSTTTVESASSMFANGYHGATCVDTSNITAGASFNRGNTSGNGFFVTGATPSGIRAFTCEQIPPNITTENLQTISIEQANVNIADAFRLMVKIEGNWYASEQSYGVDVASTGAGDWANSKVSTVNFSKAAAGWRDVVINPGVALTLAGAARSSDLPSGAIQGYGVIRATTPAGSMRFRNITLKVKDSFIQ